ncbi:HTH-type transcriptional activator Btr [compost metagenome]
MEWLIRFKMLLQKITHTEEPELYKGGLSQIRRTSTVAGLIEMIKEAAAMTVGLLDRDVKSPVVQQVLNYIHDSYNQDLSLKVLGSMYNIHPVYLGQLFHKEVDETFTEYINRYRIEKAKELLRTTNLKVQEIARNVGYWETGYFYKQFKKYVGISPTEFKGLI